MCSWAKSDFIRQGQEVWAWLAEETQRTAAIESPLNVAQQWLATLEGEMTELHAELQECRRNLVGSLPRGMPKVVIYR
jgi:hypothetical protein